MTIQQERIWIEKAKKNPKRFGPLYDHYYKNVFLFCLKRVADMETAGDVTSQVFLKALMNLAKYEDRGYPFGAWLFRIATNEVNLYYRKSKKNIFVEIQENNLHDLLNEIVPEKDPVDVQRLVIDLLNDLPFEQSQLLELRFFDQKSFKEIGEIYGISEANSKMKTYRLLEKLKKTLKIRFDEKV